MSHDDFEHLVEQSLDRRAGDLGTPTGDLSDVLRHVDRRQRRRRSVAVVGSLAIVAVGAVGFASLDRQPAENAAFGGADGVPDQPSAWRCTDQLDYFDPATDGGVYFATCEQVTIDGDAPVIGLPTPTAPADSAITVPTTSPVDEVRYTIEVGDTFQSIADRFETTPEAIAHLNDWSDLRDERIKPGNQILVLLVPISTTPHGTSPTTTTTIVPSVGEQSYTVAPGDSLRWIANLYGITLEQLLNYNEFEEGSSHLILVGDIVKIPPGAVSRDHVPTTVAGVPAPTTSLTTTP